MAYTFPVAPAGAIVFVKQNMNWVGQIMMNTHYYRIETNPGASTIKNVCDELYAILNGGAHLNATLLNLMDGSNQLTTVDIQVIAPLRYLAQKYIQGAFGNNVVTLDATNLAAFIERRGVGGTRSDVGGIHVPIPIDSTVFNNGDWVAGYITKLTAHAGLMQAGITLAGGATLAPVIYHRAKIPNYSYVGAAFYQSNVRVMRRRTKGIGI